MSLRPLNPHQLRSATRGELRVGGWPSTPSPDVLAVDLDELADGGRVPLPGIAVVGVLVGLTEREDPEEHPARAAVDVVLRYGDPSLETIERNVEAHPIAAASLALLLRGAEGRTVDEGLLAESAVYSALQAGPEFAAWRAARRERPAATDDTRTGGDGLLLERDGGVLHLTLDRPQVRNALDAATLQSLVDALRMAAGDPELDEVHLWGRGEAFCAGGDLNEFGTFADPATAHLIRLDRSVGAAMWSMRDRVTAHLHGACAGSGIELPAFAGTVSGAPSTTVSLPELSLGLIPGAGGTVSLPRRIGRHRTAWLVLSGEPVDAVTALRWGLLDDLEEEHAARR
jgi:enoyl-CoA hydratase/carnithine racemase